MVPVPSGVLRQGITVDDIKVGDDAFYIPKGTPIERAKELGLLAGRLKVKCNNQVDVVRMEEISDRAGGGDLIVGVRKAGSTGPTEELILRRGVAATPEDFNRFVESVKSTLFRRG